MNSVLKLTTKSKDIFKDIKESSIKHASDNISEELGSSIRDILVEISSKGIKLFEEVKEAADKIVDKDVEEITEITEKSLDVVEKSTDEESEDTKETEKLLGKFATRVNDILKDSKEIISKSFNKDSVVGKKVNKSIKETLFFELDEPLDKNVVKKFKKSLAESFTLKKDKSITEDVLIKLVEERLGLTGPILETVKSIVKLVSMVLPPVALNNSSQGGLITTLIPLIEIGMFLLGSFALGMKFDENMYPEFSSTMITDIVNLLVHENKKSLEGDAGFEEETGLNKLIKYVGWINYEVVKIKDSFEIEGTNFNLPGLNSEHKNILGNFKTKAAVILEDTQKIINKVNTNTNVVFKDVSESIKKEIKKIDIENKLDNLDDLSLIELVKKLTQSINNEYKEISKEIRGDTTNTNTDQNMNPKNYLKELVQDDDADTKEVLLAISKEIISRFNNNKNILIDTVKPFVNDGKIIINKIKSEIQQNSNNGLEEYLGTRINSDNNILSELMHQGTLIWYDFMLAYIELNNKESKEEGIKNAKVKIDSILDRLAKISGLGLSLGVNWIKNQSAFQNSGLVIGEETSAELMGIKRFYEAKNAKFDSNKNKKMFEMSPRGVGNGEGIIEGGQYNLPDNDLLRLAFYHLSSDPKMYFILVEKDISKDNKQIKKITGYSLGKIIQDPDQDSTDKDKFTYTIYYDSLNKKEANDCGVNKLLPSPALAERMAYPIAKSIQVDDVMEENETVDKDVIDMINIHASDSDASDASDSDSDASDSDSDASDSDIEVLAPPTVLPKLLMGGAGLLLFKKLKK